MSLFSIQRVLICIFLTSRSLAHEYNPAGWKAASKWIKTSMDETADPCNDFLSFACGKWNESYFEFNATSERGKVNLELASTIFKALEKIKVEDPNTEQFKKSMKTFYDQCKNYPKVKNLNSTVLPLIEEIYANLAEYLLPYVVEKIGDEERYPWQNSSNHRFWKFVGTMQRVLGTSFLVEAEILPATSDCKNIPILHLRPAAITMWKNNDTEVLDFLLSYVAKYHNQSFDEKDVEDTKLTLLEFTTDLKQLHNSTGSYMAELSYDPKQTTSIKYNELQKEFPSIDWDGLFNGLLPENLRETYINSNPTIFLEYQEFFRNISYLIEIHGHLTATNFGFFYALIKYTQFFLRGEMKTKDRRGRNVAVFRDDKCLDLTIRYFSSASLRLLCDEYKVNVEDWRNDILLMKDLVFSAFRFHLYSTDWIEPDEKMMFIEKANKMQFYGDIPFWIMDDSTVNSKTPKYDLSRSLIANDILAQKELFNQQMKPLITGEMDDAPPLIWQNAWNDMKGAGNIRFLVGLQLPPYYTYAYPLSVKFGAVGMIIGHELMHSFSTFLYRIKKFEGFERLLLKNSTLDLLKTKIECLIPFYDSYCTTESELFVDGKPSGSCTIGNSTIEENNADTEGLKIAYTAYKFATQTMGSEPLLNELTQYTADQLFFLAYARRSCAVSSGLKFDPRDPHSSKKARIEQPLMNFPPFAKAFGCKDGQRFSRKEVCSVYGNTLEYNN